MLDQRSKLRFCLCCGISLVARIEENVGEGLQELIDMRHKDLGLCPEKSEECSVDRSVLEGIEAQRQDGDDDCNHLIEG
jgi:hypothetical protein